MNQVGFFDIYTLLILIPTILYLYLRFTGQTTSTYNYLMSGIAAFLWGTKLVSVYGTSEPFFLGIKSGDHYDPSDTPALNALRYTFLFAAVAFFQINGSLWKQKTGMVGTNSTQPESVHPRKETKKTY